MPNTSTQNTYFIVLIGGPGIAAPCDSHHDQTWKDYVVPIQLATKNSQVSLKPGETMQWWIYGPAYRERWLNDSQAKVPAGLSPKFSHTKPSQQQIKEVTDLRKTGAVDYIDRIKAAAAAIGASVVVLEKPDDFWAQLQKLPDHSLNRLWYIGHASNDGLMLKLIHTDDPTAGACIPAANQADMIRVPALQEKGAQVISKFTNQGEPSKFYGCFTYAFAQQWNRVFHRAAAGAVNKIDFSVINQPSTFPQIMPRLEKSEANTGWTQFPAAAASPRVR